MATTAEFLSSYERIKEANKITLKEIDHAKELEAQEKPLEAIAAYKQSLKLIEKLFAIPVGLPDYTDGIETEWNDACKIIQQLKEIKVDVSQRLEVLKSQHILVDIETEEVITENLIEENGKCSETTKEFKQLIKDLREVMADKEAPVFCDILFQAQVKLYRIQPNSEVQTISGKTSMTLIMCNVGEKWSHLNGISFIQCSMVGQPNYESDQPSTSQANNLVWIYPLVPSVTTCYRTDYGALIFPDLESDIKGSAFGIMLTTPAELTEEQFSDMQQFFVDLLGAILVSRIDTSPEPKDFSQKVSKNIVTTADFIARNLVKGAEKTGDLLNKSTPYILSKINPATENSPPVPECLQNTVEVVKGVTTTAVDLTSWVANKVGSASVAVGSYLAPHIQHHSINLLQNTCGMDEQEATSKMDGALNVATGAAEGLSTVFYGLGKSAAILGKNLKDHSVKIIEHKYGSSAGFVTADTFDSFGNTFIVSQNVHHVMPLGIAKEAGFAVIDECNRNRKEESQNIVNEDLTKTQDKTEKSRGT